MKKVLLRAFNTHHLLILNKLRERGNYLTVTSMIREISDKYIIPESSLRNYVRQLVELNLIYYDISTKSPVRITADGMTVLKLIDRGES